MAKDRLGGDLLWIADNQNNNWDLPNISLDDILTGIIETSIMNFLNSPATNYLCQENLDQGTQDICEAWRTFFDIVVNKCKQLPNSDNNGSRFDRSRAISMKVIDLSPEHPIVKAILYIYSMETFIPSMI